MLLEKVSCTHCITADIHYQCVLRGDSINFPWNLKGEGPEQVRPGRGRSLRPAEGCRYYGWLGRGNIVANGHPGGGGVATILLPGVWVVFSGDAWDGLLWEPGGGADALVGAGGLGAAGADPRPIAGGAFSPGAAVSGLPQLLPGACFLALASGYTSSYAGHGLAQTLAGAYPRYTCTCAQVQVWPLG
jgi:hypothetical protein